MLFHAAADLVHIEMANTHCMKTPKRMKNDEPSSLKTLGEPQEPNNLSLSFSKFIEPKIPVSLNMISPESKDFVIYTQSRFPLDRSSKKWLHSVKIGLRTWHRQRGGSAGRRRQVAIQSSMAPWWFPHGGRRTWDM